MKFNSLLSSVVLLIPLLSTPVAYSQEIRSCATTAVDADGDGFGWEWNRESDVMDSCVITDESFSPPPIFNQETGEEIQLIRPYWNANRDIAGRDIECKGYDWDRGESRYINYGNFDSNLLHDPLPTSPPYMAYAEYDTLPFLITPDKVVYKYWTVIDGRYIGPLMGEYGVALEWLEIIEATESNGSGIRIWGGNGVPAYRDCFDKSGASFGPTGYIGEDLPTEEPAARSLIVTGTPAPDYAEPLVDLATGEPVQLTTAYWDVYKHFWERTIQCWPSTWDGSSYSPEYYNIVQNSFYAVSKGEQSGLVGTFFGQGDGGTNDEWTVSDGVMSVSGFWPITIYDKVEIVPPANGVTARIRSWHSSESFTTCMDKGGLAGPYETSAQLNLLPLDPGTIQTTPTQTIPTDSQTTDGSGSSNTNDADTSDSANTETTATDTMLDGGNSIDQSNTTTSGAASGGGSVSVSLLLTFFMLLIVRVRNSTRLVW